MSASPPDDELEPRDRDELLDELRHDRSPDARIAAMEELRLGTIEGQFELDDEIAAAVHAALVGDPSAEVRGAAVDHVLATHEDDVAVVAERARVDPDQGVRYTAINHLFRERGDDRRTYELIVEVAAGTRDDEATRTFALEVLPKARADGPLLAVLLRLARTDPSEMVRREALKSLLVPVTPPRPELGPLLLELAAGDVSDRVRQDAVEHLLGAASTDQATARELIGRIAAGDGDDALRLAAVDALAARPGDGTAPLWLDELTRGGDPMLRSAAVRAVAAHGVSAEWLAEHTGAAASPGERVAALRALGDGAMTPPVVATLLRAGTDDQHWRARQVAVQEAGARAPLTADLFAWLSGRAGEDPHWSVRQAALEAVAQRWPGAAEARALFARRAEDDEDGDLRALAAKLRDGFEG